MKAVLSDLKSGYDHDKQQLADLGLVEGVAYQVQRVDMGDCSTKIYLTDFPGNYFNSVNFKFVNDDGVEHDIYRDPAYNPYIRQRLNEAAGEKQFRGTIKNASQYSGTMFAGYVHGHPWFEEGGWIHTSAVQHVYYNELNELMAETRNSIYKIEMHEGETHNFEFKAQN